MCLGGCIFCLHVSFYIEFSWYCVCCVCLASYFKPPFDLLSRLSGAKAINKDGFLSEEEFNLWKSLYRLGDGDQVKGVVLPEPHFPSLQEDAMVSWLGPCSGWQQ